ncbi:MAG: PDZ domain-containing protein [Okeania sp. SIO3I5]|uniref:nSTAND1 domain-containing NTPase n=1 Tax=Okeania sp. SIO3I5 TaxID=2607805 RepID=UPI0013B7A496|nr:PDZ domain-containing protein [Okeania sp. SIO3I5]NEQ35379.1 PDZ domain-containing protein [Okeania sp. SIO3I5]
MTNTNVRKYSHRGCHRGQDACATRFLLFSLYMILINLGAVMGKLVTLNIDGGFHQGFWVRGEICQDVDSIKNEPLLAIASKSAHLPPHSEILEQYRHWQSLYTNLDVFFSNRLKSKAGFTNISDNDKNGAFAACKNAANLLSETFNAWLGDSDFQPIEVLLRNNLDKSESTRILLATENYGLRRLPWHEWDFLKDFPKAEISIASPNFQRVDTTKKLDKKDKIKILVILGDNAGTDADEKVIRELIPDAEICWLIEPQRSELDEPLWQKSWDILFFAGHGKTKDNGSIGTIQINAQDVLTISEIKNHLLQAVKSGLKLAIFNSCDGLGLAYQLAEGEDLHLPQIIVMRENLPVVIAPKFLQYFLENYTQGLSLYSSLRESRQRLQILEKDFPCVSWLPVLCQNPAEIPPRWWELGGKNQSSPYKGLSAFTENDTEIFFGRKVLTNSLLSKLERQNLVAVIGASGSGKSSLVAAGLIPEWLAQATEFLPRFVVKIRPGFPRPNPWENLAEELGKISPNLIANNLAFLELVVNLEANSGELAKCLTAIVQEKKGCQILLVIDQFEELYTLCSEEKRRSFLAGLVEAVRQESWKIVLTLRADFLSLVLDEDLGKIFDERDKLITPMNDQELKEAIALPAQKFEVEFADELTNRMIQDYRQNSGHLPMLQFALEELWKKQKYGVISLDSYEKIGGLTQVLGDYAEKIYCQLSQESKEEARYIFTQLVQPISQEKSGEVRQIATRKIATFADIGKENWQLVIKFADERLVVTNKEKDVASVELIHEVLISAWSRLKNWIEQDWEFRRWQEKLRDNLSQWEQEKKDDFLLQGGLLKEAESWLEKGEQKIPEKERRYVEKSRKRRERERQKLISGLTGGLAIVSLFAVGMVWQWQSAERQSLINEVDSLSNLALNQFQSGEGGISALMTAMDAGQKLKKLVKDDEKLGNYPTTQPLLALQTITSNIREKNEFQSDSAISRVFFTPDGKQIVSYIYSKVIILNLAGEKLAEWKMPNNQKINDLVVSPNGKYIATTYGGTFNLGIWDFSGKKITEGFFPSLFTGSKIKFSPDSKYVFGIAPFPVNKINFFDILNNQTTYLKIDTKSAISSLELTRNGEQIAIGHTDGSVEFWNLKTLEKTREFKANTNEIIKIAISPDGKRILTLGTDISSDKIVGLAPKLWDLSGKKVVDLGFYGNMGQLSGDVSFSPDGKEIAIVILDKRVVKFYDTVSGKLIDKLTMDGFHGFNLSYSLDSKKIAISGGSGIKLFNKAKPNFNFMELPINYEREINQFRQKGFIDLRYSSDGKKLIVISKHYDGNYNYVDIWDWQRRKKRRIDVGESLMKSKYWTNSSTISNVASITPDGKFIVFVIKDGIKKFDLEGDLISQLETSVSPYEEVLTTWTSATNYVAHRYYSSNLDGSKVATIEAKFSDLDRLRFWDLSTQEVKEFKDNSLVTLRRVLVSPNGKYILAISTDGISKLWGVSGNLLNPLDASTEDSSNKKEKIFSIPSVLLAPKGANDDEVKIIMVLENSTAMKAGLRSDDRIVEIDDQEISDIKNVNEIYKLLMEEPGTTVKIKVRNLHDVYGTEKTIIREKFFVNVKNLEWLFMEDNAKFSPDSQYLVTWDIGGKNVSLRNINTRKIVKIDDQDKIMDVFFSPDNRLLATISIEHSIKIWDFSGKLINQIKLQQIPNGIAFSPDSQQIAVLGYPNELTIWTLDGQQIAKYTIPEERQDQIVFSPDGKYIATGRSKVFIWQNKHLNELLATGCDWLQEYLTTHPQEKEKLKVCQEEVK